MFGVIMPLCNRMFCCIFGWFSLSKSGWNMKKLFCCPALELFHCLPLWKTVLCVSSRAFLLSTPTILLSTPAENSEATWKKATKCNKSTSIWKSRVRHSVKAKMAYGKQIMRGRKRAPVHTFPVIRVATPKKDSLWIKSDFVRKLMGKGKIVFSSKIVF